MSVKLDWQIIDEDEPWTIEQPPLAEPRRRVFRRWMLALALIPAAAIAAAAAYIAWTYRTQLDRVAGPVQQVARLELQSEATGDRASFMALQDPDDPAWRAWQERGLQLQRAGLLEYGWEVTGTAPTGPCFARAGRRTRERDVSIRGGAADAGRADDRYTPNAKIL